MKLNTLTALAFATTAILSNTPSLAAEKVTSYNGAFCKAQDGADVSHISYSNCSIFNAANLTLIVLCPAMVTDGFINKGARVWVNWTARNAADVLSCNFYSLYADNSIVRPNTLLLGCGRGSGWLLPTSSDCSQISGTPGVTPTFTVPEDNASYVMVCRLPPGGRINAMQVNEIL